MICNMSYKIKGMNSKSESETLNRTNRLWREALVVGAASLPSYYFTHAVVSAVMPTTSDGFKEFVSVFVSGALFHLVCEETGVNAWYLDNSVAAMKKRSSACADSPREFTTGDEALCDGSCGWTPDGLCSHYAIHAPVLL